MPSAAEGAIAASFLLSRSIGEVLAVPACGDRRDNSRTRAWPGQETIVHLAVQRPVLAPHPQPAPGRIRLDRGRHIALRDLSPRDTPLPHMRFVKRSP